MRRSPTLAAVVCLLGLAGAARGAEPRIAVDLGGGITLDLVRVKAGSFRQGSPSGEPGRGDDETPRDVTLTHDFYLGAFPVTRGQFARFVAETGYRTEAEKGDSGGFGWDGRALVQRKEFTWRNPGFVQTDAHPVTIVTYDDALAFAAWLQKKAGRSVSLPTEAEWEYATRAGTKSAFYAGDSEDLARTIAWFKANAGDGTRPVGGKKPNAFGLHDTSGSVYEWCRDWYGPYVAGPVTDPEETRSTLSDKPRRVLRGGSWLKEARHCRSAARYRNTPGSRNPDNGFRVRAAVETQPAPAPAARSAAAPVATGSPGKSEGLSFGAVVALVVGFFAAVGGAVLFFVYRAFRGLRRFGAADVRVQPEVDGFWLKAPEAATGSRVRYSYVADGATQTGEVQVLPGPEGKGQFVYTGGRPSRIEVAALLAREARSPRAPTPKPSAPERREPDEPSSFRGFPSAY